MGSAAHVSRKSNKLPLQVVQDSMVAFIRSCMTSILQPFGQTVDELQKWHGRGNIFDGFVRLLARAKLGIAHRIRSKQRHQLFPSWHLSNTQEFKCGLLQGVLWFMPTKIGLLGYLERSCPLRTHRLVTTLG